MTFFRSFIMKYLAFFFTLISLALTHPLLAEQNILSGESNLSDFSVSESVVATVINDHDERIVTLYAIINNEDQSLVGLRKRTTINNQEISNERFLLEEFYSGVVLDRRDKIDLVTLRTTDMTAESGGSMRIIFLYNGILSTFKFIDIQIYNVNGIWGVYDLEGQKINGFFLKTNKVFGTAVGIKEIILGY